VVGARRHRLPTRACVRAALAGAGTPRGSGNVLRACERARSAAARRWEGAQRRARRANTQKRRMKATDTCLRRTSHAHAPQPHATRRAPAQRPRHHALLLLPPRAPRRGRGRAVVHRRRSSGAQVAQRKRRAVLDGHRRRRRRDGACGGHRHRQPALAARRRRQATGGGARAHRGGDHESCHCPDAAGGRRAPRLRRARESRRARVCGRLLSRDETHGRTAGTHEPQRSTDPKQDVGGGASCVDDVART
jgi:hypothetical protein